MSKRGSDIKLKTIEATTSKIGELDIFPGAGLIDIKDAVGNILKNVGFSEDNIVDQLPEIIGKKKNIFKKLLKLGKSDPGQRLSDAEKLLHAVVDKFNERIEAYKNEFEDELNSDRLAIITQDLESFNSWLSNENNFLSQMSQAVSGDVEVKDGFESIQSSLDSLNELIQEKFPKVEVRLDSSVEVPIKLPVDDLREIQSIEKKLEVDRQQDASPSAVIVEVRPTEKDLKNIEEIKKIEKAREILVEIHRDGFTDSLEKLKRKCSNVKEITLDLDVKEKDPLLQLEKLYSKIFTPFCGVITHTRDSENNLAEDEQNEYEQAIDMVLAYDIPDKFNVTHSKQLMIHKAILLVSQHLREKGQDDERRVMKQLAALLPDAGTNPNVMGSVCEVLVKNKSAALDDTWLHWFYRKMGQWCHGFAENFGPGKVADFLKSQGDGWMQKYAEGAEDRLAHKLEDNKKKSRPR